ncbi:MAG: Ig-like domain-containing protein [Gemmatimonadaceae bacterium]|nr:Ig-like domain-containing protein [Gemmatimonadaceae bacterium]
MPSLSLRSTLSGAARLRRSRVSSILLLGTLLSVGACSEDTPADPIRVATVEVTPRLSTARVGTTQQLSAVAKDASGNPMTGETFTWKSSEPSVATVSATGLVSLVGPGSTAILASARGTSGFATIVSDANVATISLSAATLSFPVPLTRQLLATVKDAAGNDLFRPITWTSSAPTVATVSSAGVVTGISAGSATITATVEGKSATTAATILPPVPVITLSLNTGYMPIGVGVPIVATLRDANGVELLGRIVTWTTSNPAIATVSASGVVTALAAGSVTITASNDGGSAVASFTTLRGLASATPVTFTNAAVNTSTFFAVYVPAGSTNFAIAIRGGNGDPDLYLYRPGQTTVACASENGGSTIVEDCAVANPAAGVWRIEVFAYEAHAGTTITATVVPTPP